MPTKKCANCGHEYDVMHDDCPQCRLVEIRGERAQKEPGYLENLSDSERSKVKRWMKDTGKQIPVATKECPHCYSEIDARATVCPNCRKRVDTGSIRYHIGSFTMALGVLSLIVALLIDPLSCGITGVILLLIGWAIRNN